MFARGLVRLPNHPQLLKELRLLERRTHRSGKDTVDHGRSGHDDYANAACGVLRILAGGGVVGYDASFAAFQDDYVDKDAPNNNTAAEAAGRERAQRLLAYIQTFNTGG
jgi:hypothetical protein